jgi:hypothetical protein
VIARRTLALVAAIILGFTLTGCAGSDDPDPVVGQSSTTASTTTAATGKATATGTATASVTAGAERLRGLPDFPVTVTPDPTWTPVAPDEGTLSFRGPNGVSTISVHALSSLAATPADEVPEDVAAFLQQERPDIVVDNVTSVTLSGLPAQRFRITMSPGRSPSDLWKSAGGSGYKPLATDPMEVVAVRSTEGLVFVWTEWAPENEAAALAWFDAAFPSVTVE